MDPPLDEAPHPRGSSSVIAAPSTAKQSTDKKPHPPPKILRALLADPSTDILPAGHHVRITQTGKLRSYIGHAMDWLKFHPDVPIVFHTLPLSHIPNPPSSTSTKSKLPSAGPSVPTATTTTPSTALTNSTHPTRPPSTMTIPKLISVVELVKRQYQSTFKGKEGGGGRMWQYNLSGCLDVLGREGGIDSGKRKGKGKGKGKESGGGGGGEGEGEGEGQGGGEGEGPDMELIALLEGGGRIKMTHSPYMIIVLSTRGQTHLQVSPSVTYQAIQPLSPTLPKKRGRTQTEGIEEKARRLYAELQAKKKGKQSEAGGETGRNISGDQGVPVAVAGEDGDVALKELEKGEGKKRKADAVSKGTEEGVEADSVTQGNERAGKMDAVEGKKKKARIA